MELISKQKLLAGIDEVLAKVKGDNDLAGTNAGDMAISMLKCFREDVAFAEVVEAESVVHAHWIGHYEDDGLVGPGKWCCSRCHEVSVDRPPRCPECGAHMDEEVHNNG